MFKHSVLAAILLAVFAATLSRAQSTSSPELPEGPMQAKAATACTECHEARIIVQQRLSKGAWTKEVDKMTKWGALVDPQDRDALSDYLSTNFGVDRPEYLAEHTQGTAGNKQKK